MYATGFVVIDKSGIDMYGMRRIQLLQYITTGIFPTGILVSRTHLRTQCQKSEGVIGSRRMGLLI